ncbi:hypothetical protein AB0C40_35190 [Streptomyces brevispora]|uniref:hypothetical protein n=1 Tax=Streptomyces brevispora TaxID=887462 RepID=UPI0033CCA3BD
MQDWNTPHHRIADTVAGNVPLVVADWEVTENAPDSDGHIYVSVCGRLVNGGGSGRVGDPHTEPIEAGRARLMRTEPRGREPITGLDVHVTYYSPGQPYPNAWDHRGCQVTISWMDRRIEAIGQPIGPLVRIMSGSSPTSYGPRGGLW